MWRVQRGMGRRPPPPLEANALEAYGGGGAGGHPTSGAGGDFYCF